MYVYILSSPPVSRLASKGSKMKKNQLVEQGKTLWRQQPTSTCDEMIFERDVKILVTSRLENLNVCIARNLPTDLQVE